MPVLKIRAAGDCTVTLAGKDVVDSRDVAMEQDFVRQIRIK